MNKKLQEIERNKDNIKLEETLVSIILPTANLAKKIIKCLESINNQSYKNIEIIVVVPSKSDEFINLAKKYNFNLIYCSKGKNVSRNRGYEQSKGEYLLLLDDDMRLSKKVIFECVETALKGDYKAVAIPEIEEKSKGLYNKIRILEKIIVASDIYVTAPRFIKKDVFEELGKIDPRLDPIDEGDLKAKLKEKEIPYATTKSIIVLSSKNRMSSLRSRWFHMYKRGQKMPLFNLLHPDSNQLRPIKRISPYIQEFRTLVKEPIVGLCLVFIKAFDLIFLNFGALNISKKDKNIISSLKNKAVFEKEADSYQKEFFENTLGAKHVDRIEKEIVKKYLSTLNKNSNLKVLDIGPGGGRWSQLMLDYLPKSEVYACDLSVGMVENLKEKFKGRSRFNALVGDMQSLPFKDNYFDLVLSIRAIKYAQNQKKVFEEVHRVLKPNAKGIMELPYLNFVYRIVRRFRVFGRVSEYANRIIILDERSVKHIFREIGFKIKYTEKVFTVPATIYKNCNSIVCLSVLNGINSLLPKRIFGRSLFVIVRKK